MKKLLACLLFLLSTTALAANTATLTWTNTDTRAVTNNIYQGLQGQPKTLVQSNINGTTFQIVSGLASGTTVCFQVTAAFPGLAESAPSNEACKIFPADPPPVVAAPKLNSVK